jgi:hypothetical protein
LSSTHHSRGAGKRNLAGAALLLAIAVSMGESRIPASMCFENR